MKYQLIFISTFISKVKQQTFDQLLVKYQDLEQLGIVKQGPGLEQWNETEIQEGPYKRGGMPLMSDSLFSLIILIYVSVAFLFVFFMFCWRSANSDNSGEMSGKGMNGNLSCPLMSLEDIIGGKRQQDKPQSIMMKILSDELEEEFSIK